MTLKAYTSVVVVTDKAVHLSKYGYTTKTSGDGVLTVDLPNHMIEFFRDKGFVV